MRTWSKLIVSYTKPLVAKLTKPRTYTHTEASQSVSKAYITPVTPKEAFGDLATRDLLRGLVALALARTPGVATYGGKFLESIHR